MKTFFYFFIILFSHLVALPVYAQALWEKVHTDSTLGPVGDVFGSPFSAPRDLPSIIAEIIKIVLSFVALIFVIMIISAGFKWMTAGGDDNKIDQARNALKHSIIGLLIVIAAWAITHFVATQLLEITGAND
jgi:hypothetical protein